VLFFFRDGMRAWLPVFLFLIPFASAATLQGVVVDDLGNLVRGAELKFSCAGAIDAPNATDRFGSFTARVENGTCRITALHRGSSGTLRMEVTEDFHDVEVRIANRNSAVYGWLFGGALAGLAVWRFWPRRKAPAQQADAKEARVTTVLSVLPKKEQEIVQYLLAHGKASANANIRHELHIPRTTMKRLLASLESKQVVSLDKQGKAVKVSLNERFSGAEMEQ